MLPRTQPMANFTSPHSQQSLPPPPAPSGVLPPSNGAVNRFPSIDQTVALGQSFSAKRFVSARHNAEAAAAAAACSMALSQSTPSSAYRPPPSTFNGVVSPPIPMVSSNWIRSLPHVGSANHYHSPAPFLYSSQFTGLPENVQYSNLQNIAASHMANLQLQQQHHHHHLRYTGTLQQVPFTRELPPSSAALQHQPALQPQEQQQQTQPQQPLASDVRSFPKRRRPPVTYASYSGDDDDNDDDDDDDFQLPSSNSSPSYSEDKDDADYSDSDFPGKSRARSTRRRRGRPRGRPGLRSRGGTADRAGRISDDGSEDLWPAAGPSSVVRGRRRWNANLRARRRTTLEDSDTASSSTPSNQSDSSYCSGRRQRRRNGDNLALVMRTSTSRPAKAVRVNYAQLGLLSNEEEDDDESVPENDAEEDQIAQAATPGVDRVLGYRLIGSSDDYSVVPLQSGDGTAVDPSMVEILIKWTGWSHLHNTWEQFADLQQRGVSGLRKIENFFRRMQTLLAERQFMTEVCQYSVSLHHTLEQDEIEQQDIALELQKQIDQDCLIAERVVSHQTELIPDAEYSDEPGRKVDAFFVKWTNCPYDQCTWETAEVLQAHGFQSLVDQYWAREDRLVGSLSARHPLHAHALSRTSFEPYRETPWFLKEGNPNNDRQLRDYQILGINWMISRMKKGLSVLLADEMGLGKTVQTLSVIGHIMFAELICGPFLVVVPQSTADNWLHEFHSWLPSVNVVVYHGNPTARDIIRQHELTRIRAAPYVEPPASECDSRVAGHRIGAAGRRQRYRCDVCICTPSILNNVEDLEFLRGIDWYLMAIDEAHLLKNRTSRRFRELNQFRTRYRLLLSGTPLHNNLEEMWSLLHFLSPLAYDDLGAFKERFSEIERTDSVGELKEKQIAMLQRELHEIVLRRVKKDVEKSLPKKVERILRVELSPKQSQCCEAIIARNYEVLAKTSGGSKASLQNICMELKKVCNHPLLLQTDIDISELQSAAALSPQARQEWQQTLLHSSGKLSLLDKLLPYLKERGHRVLIFSQMVRMLNILSRYLTFRGFKHQRLDGTMSREVRKKAMDHFNAPDSDDFCFLLSTKAGGLGINLTTADTVIIYDSDWNPQNDLQAEARAHRIGQTKTVQIYRLVTKDTVEEKILERAKAKMVLDTLVIQGLNKRQAENPDTTTASSSVSPGVAAAGVAGAHATTLAKDSFGFSREELTKILKFGATKLWRSSTNGITPSSTLTAKDMPSSEEGSVVVDLDRILAEAEEQDSESPYGVADELLSSFTNISDFRYEAPPDPPEYDDKDFWEKTIPLEERLKFQGGGEKTETSPNRKRQRKQVESVSKAGAEFGRYLDAENSRDNTAKRKAKAKKPVPDKKAKGKTKAPKDTQQRSARGNRGARYLDDGDTGEDEPVTTWRRTAVPDSSDYASDTEDADSDCSVKRKKRGSTSVREKQAKNKPVSRRTVDTNTTSRQGRKQPQKVAGALRGGQPKLKRMKRAAVSEVVSTEGSFSSSADATKSEALREEPYEQPLHDASVTMGNETETDVTEIPKVADDKIQEAKIPKHPTVSTDRIPKRTVARTAESRPCDDRPQQHLSRRVLASPRRGRRRPSRGAQSSSVQLSSVSTASDHGSEVPLCTPAAVSGFSTEDISSRENANLSESLSFTCQPVTAAEDRI